MGTDRDNGQSQSNAVLCGEHLISIDLSVDSKTYNAMSTLTVMQDP